MSPRTTQPSLGTEISRLARLGNLQSGVPPVLRVLPVIAIAAGEAASRITGHSNKIEEHLIGPDGTTILLQGPGSTKKLLPTWHVHGRSGVMTMCLTCHPAWRADLSTAAARELGVEYIGLSSLLTTQTYPDRNLQRSSRVDNIATNSRMKRL
jgi:hypothetical protein